MIGNEYDVTMQDGKVRTVIAFDEDGARWIAGNLSALYSTSKKIVSIKLKGL